MNPVTEPSAMDTAPDMKLPFTFLDWLVVAAYLLAMVLVVMWVNRHSGHGSESFFLGGRSMPWWAIGCSLFASNVGTDHLVGLAGSGAAGGLAVGLYEWNAAYVLLLLAYLFVPHYMAYHIYTVPEYLEKRFNKRLRDFFTVLTIAATFFTKITVTIFAGALVLNQLLGLNMWLSSIGLLLLTSLYTSTGGLAAVVYTEVLQVVVLMAGTAVLLWFGMKEVGGWTGLHEKLPDSHFQILKPNSDPDFPWLGVLIGMPINSVWYWCTDQVMVQRVLGASSPADAQRGCVMAAWLKLTPMFLMVLPGLVAAALFPAEMKADSNRAFPLLVERLMPAGLVGLMVAAMLSSFMGALASCFNSCSTLFTMDVYRVISPDAPDEMLVLAGRLFTLLVAACSIVWLPVILNSNEQLFLYIQSMQNIWCGPISVVFVASIVSPEVSASSAWITLVVGLGIGLGTWIVQNILTASMIAGMSGLERLQTLSILLYAPISAAVCAVVLVVAHIHENGASSTAERTVLNPEAYPARYNESIRKQKWAGWFTASCGAGVVIAVSGMISFMSTW